MGFKTVATLDTPKLMGNINAPNLNIVPVANRAYLIRAWTGRYLTPHYFGFIFRTLSGNYDLGVYDLAFNRIFSTGSKAAASFSTYNLSVVASNFRTLKPGAYWLALAIDNAVARFDGKASTAVIGNVAAFKDASFPLPASLAGATLAAGGAVDMPSVILGMN